MLRKLLGASVSLLALSLWNGAAAQSITRGWSTPAVASAPVVSCPFGSDPTADGCNTAPATAQVQLANYLTSSGALKSGQTYAIVQNHNLTCVDYKCGPTTAQASEGDPLDTANYPHGAFECGPITHGSFPNDYVIMDCGGTINFTFQHLNTGRAFGHGPVYYNFHNSSTGSIAFNDVWFQNDTGCTAPPETINHFIFFQAGANANLTMTNFSMDGLDATCRYIGPMAGMILPSGNKTLSRFYIHDISLRVVDFNGGSSTTDVMKWGLVDCYNTIPQAGHAELGLFSSLTSQTYNSFTFLDVTINNCTHQAATGTAPLFLTNGGTGGGTTFGTVLIDGLYSIGNTVLGSPNSPNTGTLNVTVAAAASGAGTAVLTLNSISSGILVEGMEVQGSTNAFDLFPMVKLSGTGGAGSTFSVACGPNNGACPAAPTGPFTTSSGALIPGSSYAAQAGAWGSWTMSASGAEAGGASYVSLTIRNSQIDLTGSALARAWTANADAVCTVPAVFTGNTSLLTGAALNAWSSNGSATC